MDQDLTKHYSTYNYTEHQYQMVSISYYYNNVIILVFLIAGLCVGFPALAWTLHVVRTHWKNKCKISSFVLLLLLNDLLELLLGAFILICILSDTPKRISTLASLKMISSLLWDALKIAGLYLHQLVALDSALSSRKHLCCAQILSPPCSTIFGVILWMVGFGCQLVPITKLNLISFILPICLLATTSILTCKFPPTHRDLYFPTDMKPGLTELIVSTITLFAFGVQFIVALYFKSIQWVRVDNLTYVMFGFLVSMRVISDPLLCVLVCKESIRFQTAHTRKEIRDQQSV